jgi:hypothetical protein
LGGFCRIASALGTALMVVESIILAIAKDNNHLLGISTLGTALTLIDDAFVY